MQQYGCPTRLLDWTQSPYVAAYFACRDDHEHAHDGAVWVVAKGIIQRIIRDTTGSEWDAFDTWINGNQSDNNEDFAQYLRNMVKNPIGKQLARFFGLTWYEERMDNQEGRFSVCARPTDDLVDVLSASPVPEGLSITPLQKIIIRNDETVEGKREYMRRLRQMNFTGYRLFPGLDGVGQMIRETIDFRL